MIHHVSELKNLEANPMNIRINTPEGTRDRLFSECLQRRQVQSALVERVRGRGYTEVITP